MFYYYSVANSLTKWLYRVPKWVTAHGANTQRSNMIQGDCSRWTPHRNLQPVAVSVTDFSELDKMSFIKSKRIVVSYLFC